ALRAIPGAQAAGLGSDLPWTGYDDNIGGFLMEGLEPQHGDRIHGRYHVVTAQYFRALRIPVLGGRFFPYPPRKDTKPVLMIYPTMAKMYWRGQDPVGRRVAFTDNPKEADWNIVVGVVGDVKDRPENPSAEPAFWWPLSQMPGFGGSVALAVRS